ncbi:type VI secretion system Vgr family protein [Robbsia sp. KACC 23696]|uniref:type VI secretion system Vgr family protein n=1 Tax=Robbsia sp. KACC 23696 TaxID=3149231 RepID=UPI00325AC0B6
MSILDDLTGALTQQERLLVLTTPLGDGVLIPERMVGHSRLGRQFEFTIDLVSTTPDVPLKTLIAQPISLGIQMPENAYQALHGYVHTARRLGSDGTLTSYQITAASWMHFLKFRRDQRTWNDRSVVDILSDVFDQHPEAAGRYRFALSREIPNRSYCRQNETDWNFVHRTMEHEGWFGFWQQAADGSGHTLVITDTLTSIDSLTPESVNFYRADIDADVNAFTQWSGTRTLQSTTYTTRTFDYKNPAVRTGAKGTQTPTLPTQGALPSQAEVYEYTGSYTYSAQTRGDALSRIRMEEWESRAKRFYGSGAVRGVDAGKRFTLRDHPVHDTDDSGTKEFAIIDVHWSIENNLSVGTTGADYPHSLQEAIATARASQESTPGTESAATLGRAMSSALSKARGGDGNGSDGFYFVEIEAQRTSVPFRSPFEHPKPPATLETAIVVTQAGQEVYTDSLNRVRVLFPWDRINNQDETGSCWVRIAQSHAGTGYGHVQQPRAGEEVLIDYIGGDIDRPVIIARLYNGSATPQWHTNGLLSGYRSKEYGGTGYNQLVMDDATGQNRTQLYSSSENSHLHLGYLVEHEGNARGAYLGSGFDLKSDAYGAIRAAQGLYLTTHATSSSQPLAVSDSTDQLASAETLIERLSQASVSNQAETLQAGQDALKTFNNATQYGVAGGTGTGGNTAGGGTGSANGFSSPVMLMGSASGIALATNDSTHVAANKQITLVSGQSTHLAVGKSLVASVVEKISLFVQNAGIKLFAAKGKVEIQAQSDEMALNALKDLTISSANGKIVLTAANEIWIGAKGSYIKINANGIESGTPGTILEKCGAFTVEGQASAIIPVPINTVDVPCTTRTTAAAASSASVIALS